MAAEGWIAIVDFNIILDSPSAISGMALVIFQTIWLI